VTVSNEEAGHPLRETGERQVVPCVTGTWEEISSHRRPAPCSGSVKWTGKCHGD